MVLYGNSNFQYSLCPGNRQLSPDWLRDSPAERRYGGPSSRGGVGEVSASQAEHTILLEVLGEFFWGEVPTCTKKLSRWNVVLCLNCCIVFPVPEGLLDDIIPIDFPIPSMA